MECFRLLFDHLEWIKHQFLSGIRDSRKAGSLWGMIRRVGGVRKSIHQSWLAKGLGLGLLCWGFKAVQEGVPSEEACTLQIGSVVFPPGQCTSPQLHRCHGQFEQVPIVQTLLPVTFAYSLWLLLILQVPIVRTLLPVTFAYSLSSEAVVRRQLRRWKSCVKGHWHAHTRTSMGPSRSCWNDTPSALHPEEITSKGTRVSCVYY